MEIPHICITSVNTVNERINLSISLLVFRVQAVVCIARWCAVLAGSVSLATVVTVAVLAVKMEVDGEGVSLLNPRQADFNHQETTSNPAPLHFKHTLASELIQSPGVKVQIGRDEGSESEAFNMLELCLKKSCFPLVS